MLGLNPSKNIPYKSEDKKIFRNKKYLLTLSEFYGEINYLKLKLSKDRELIKSIKMPLNWRTFYIWHIYRHTGKCHKNLRSRFYIGRARERRIK